MCLLTDRRHCSGVSAPSLATFVSYAMEKKEKLSDAEVLPVLASHRVAPLFEGNFLCIRQGTGRRYFLHRNQELAGPIWLRALPEGH